MEHDSTWSITALVYNKVDNNQKMFDSIRVRVLGKGNLESCILVATGFFIDPKTDYCFIKENDLTSLCQLQVDSFF